ncbi:MAG: hypothetical protein WCP91_00305 [Candidatus Berkelbacteria bacterium]
MKKKKTDLDLPEPTDDEIKQLQELTVSKLGIKVPKKDARKMAVNAKELNWWMEKTKSPTFHMNIDDKHVLEFQKLVKEHSGKETTLAEARQQSQGLLLFASFKEKQRLADETREILTNYREVKYDPALLEKTAKLVKTHYGIDLSDGRQKQLLHLISKVVWYTVGLDEPIGVCLDELITYADKRKRGKKVSHFYKYKEVKQHIDWALRETKLIEGDFDPLCNDEPINIEYDDKKNL